MAERKGARTPDFQYVEPGAKQPTLRVFLGEGISKDEFLASHPGLEINGDQLTARRDGVTTPAEPAPERAVVTCRQVEASTITAIPTLSAAEIKAQTQHTAHEAIQAAVTVETITHEPRSPMELLRLPYDLAAQGLYNPKFILNRMLAGMITESTLTQQAAFLAVEDMLRSVFEQHFAEFQGKAGLPLRVAGSFLKHPAVSSWFQFIPSLDAVSDGILTAADVVGGKSLIRLGVDAAIMGYDAIPLPLPGDVALLSPGLDRSERILQYSLMEALYLGMTDSTSPLYEQREHIARAILKTQSLIARTANATLLNEDESLGGKMGVIKVNEDGALRAEVGPIKIPLTRSAKKPELTQPYAERIPDATGRAAELRAKLKAQGTLTNDEFMQLAMCNLILVARSITGEQQITVDAAPQIEG